jgi:RHS repeat-associated protein
LTGAALRYTVTHGATTLLDILYTRDSLDRIVQTVETVQGTTSTRGFTYDSLGRLDTVRLNGLVVSDYAYDSNRNRTSLTTGSGTTTATYDDQDRMLTYGGATYSYTANGELALKVVGTDTTRYTYDVFANMRQVRLPVGTVVDNLVDPRNRRIGKRVNGVLVQAFLYQTQLAPVAELDGAGSIVSRFVYATRPNVPDYMVRDGVTYRMVLDHLGSVRLVVNTVTGAVAQRIDYDEFGRVTQNTNPGFQPFGFAGGMTDDLSQLVRFGARDFDPETGRWTSKDPRGFLAGSTNLLAYASNDPVSRIDPDGLCDSCDKPPPEAPVCFIGESGTLSVGFGGSVGAGIILSSGSGPGLYFTAAGGFGGDVGYGTTFGRAASLGALKGKSEGGNLGFGYASGSRFTNPSGQTLTVTIGPRVPLEDTVYPLSMSVQTSYAFAITARDIICAFLQAGKANTLPRQAFDLRRLERLEAYDR